MVPTRIQSRSSYPVSRRNRATDRQTANTTTATGLQERSRQGRSGHAVVRIRYATTIATAVLFAAGCSYLPGQSDGGTGANTDSPTASLTATCTPAQRTPGEAGAVAYDLTLTNPGSQTADVGNVGIIFYGQNGAELGPDDPATVDNGEANPIQALDMSLLIAAGQSVTLPMETYRISGASDGWSCSLGAWSEG